MFSKYNIFLSKRKMERCLNALNAHVKNDKINCLSFYAMSFFVGIPLSFTILGTENHNQNLV